MFTSAVITAAFVLFLLSETAAVPSSLVIRAPVQGIVEGFTCPMEDIQSTGCLGAKDCLYADPENCSDFIRCDTDGVAHYHLCPHGLYWDDFKKMCDWSSNTGCTTASSTTLNSTGSQ